MVFGAVTWIITVIVGAVGALCARCARAVRALCENAPKGTEALCCVPLGSRDVESIPGLRECDGSAVGSLDRGRIVGHKLCRWAL